MSPLRAQKIRSFSSISSTTLASALALQSHLFRIMQFASTILCVAAILSTVAGFSSPTIITRNAALTKINVNSNSLNFSAQQSQLHMSDAVADSGDVSQKEDEIVEKVSTRITIRAYT